MCSHLASAMPARQGTPSTHSGNVRTFPVAVTRGAATVNVRVTNVVCRRRNPWSNTIQPATLSPSLRYALTT